jgi:F-type H+-transporting ATPase subunit b
VLVVVNRAGSEHPLVKVILQEEETTTTETAATEKTPPNPILPVPKEMVYAFVGFLALFLIIRLLLFPKFKASMEARQARIRGDHETAERTRAAAEHQAADYEAGIGEARAEANRILEAARAEVEADRQAKVAAANARIGERRAVATAETDAAKAAAMGQVEEAVGEVAATIAGRALGRTIDPASVRDVVSEVVNAGVAR